MKSASVKDDILSHFDRQKGHLLNGNSTPTFRSIREEAMARFSDLGIPNRKDEAWKYTNIEAVLKKGIVWPDGQTDVLLDAGTIAPYLIPDLDAYVVVTLNGRFMTELSATDDLQTGLTISALEDAAHDHQDLVERHFARYADYRSEPFVAINTALATSGTFIHVDRNTDIERPIHLIHLVDAPDGLMLQRRNLIVTESNSRVRIVESYHSISTHSVFSNVVTEVVTGAHSNVEHFKIQGESNQSTQVCTLQGYQSESSTFSTFTVVLDCGTLRNNINLHPDGEHCETHMYGLTLSNETQHVDHHTFVDHAKPNCHSNELYKGILDDASTVVFRGKLFVRKDAQKINAFQSNQNLLLTNDATTNSLPQLEIYADDVRCSHGATTGHMDDDAVFYFRARGIPENKARLLLMKAFLNEVTENIKIEALHRHIDALVDARLTALL